MDLSEAEQGWVPLHLPPEATCGRKPAGELHELLNAASEFWPWQAVYRWPKRLARRSVFRPVKGIVPNVTDGYGRTALAAERERRACLNHRSIDEACDWSTLARLVVYLGCNLIIVRELIDQKGFQTLLR